MRRLPTSALGPTPTSKPFFRQLARGHQALFAAGQKRIACQLGVHSDMFAAYERAYLVHSRRPAQICAPKLLAAAARGARYIFVGDYHTLAASRMAFLQLLEPLLDTSRSVRGTPLIVALEYFSTPEQAALDAFVQRRIDLATLRRRVHRAGVTEVGDAAWPSYEPLLRWARKFGVPLVALDSPRRGAATLGQRDRHAAAVLAQISRRRPHAQIAVLAGQLHIVPQHLPRAVARARRIEARHPLVALDALCVYQNCEAQFLRQLRTAQLPLGTTLKLGRRIFVLMHTAPIAAQATFVRALEANFFDGGVVDLSEQLCELARQAAALLGYTVPRGLDAWEAEGICAHGDIDAFVRRYTLSAAERHALALRLRRGLCAWLPRAQRLWVPKALLAEDQGYRRMLGGSLLWLHAQTPVLRLRPGARMVKRLDEAFAVAAGALCAQLLHPQHAAAQLLPPLPLPQGLPRHGQHLGRALAHGLLTGRIRNAQILALFAPRLPTMARFVRWQQLAGLVPDIASR